MNDRKRAWQLLHIEIRRRADDRPTDETWSTQVDAILREADSLVSVIIELAGFGATFALMGEPKRVTDAGSGESLGIVMRDPERAKRIADVIGAGVMRESDEPEPSDDDEEP